MPCYTELHHRRSERKLQINYEEIESKLQYRFNDRGLLLQAFTHSSYANVENLPDNERMEFLGDAIMDMIVSEYYYDAFPELSAGELSVMRSNVVSADGLRPIVDSMDLLKYLQVSNGSKQIKNLSKKNRSQFVRSDSVRYLFGRRLGCRARFCTASYEVRIDRCCNGISQR